MATQQFCFRADDHHGHVAADGLDPEGPRTALRRRRHVLRQRLRSLRSALTPDAGTRR